MVITKAEPSGTEKSNARAAQIERVFREQYGRAVAVLTRTFGDIEVAEEAVAEAFAIAVKLWPDTGLPKSPAGWIILTARNRALDEVRRPRHTIDLPEEALERVAGDDPGDPLERRQGSEQLRRLMACLAALAEDRRQMILLAYYRGWTREALSKRFERPVPTIKTLLHRSLAQLKGCLGDG